MPDGKRCQRSTGTSDKRKALRLANEFERAAQNLSTARQARRVMMDIHRDLTDEDLPTSTVEKYARDWLKRKEGTVAPSSLAAYKGTIDAFLKFLEIDAQKDLAEISERQISAFRDSLSQRLAPRTVNGYIKKLGLVFSEAVRGGWIPDDPTKNLTSLKIPKESKPRRPFTIDEVRKVLAHANGEWRSMVIFGIYTGQRLGDLATLRWEQMDLIAGDISFTTAKTGRRVIVPICEPLKEHILTLPSSDDSEAYVHPEIGQTHDEAGRGGTLSNQFTRILGDAGLREAKPHTKQEKRDADRRKVSRVSFHSLRHSAVSWMKNAGVSAAIVQDIVGHDSAEISAHYTVIDREAKASALSKMPTLVHNGEEEQ